MSPKRPVLTPSTVDYSTQGDPNQIAPQANYEYSQNNSTTAIQNINNYLIPDGSNRCIHDLQDKILHTGILKNGHNAYLVKLPDLKLLLHTSRYLMDEITGQFYAVYGNSYQCMCTIPRLLYTWEPGQLITSLLQQDMLSATWDPHQPHKPDSHAQQAQFTLVTMKT